MKMIRDVGQRFVIVLLCVVAGAACGVSPTPPYPRDGTPTITPVRPVSKGLLTLGAGASPESRATVLLLSIELELVGYSVSRIAFPTALQLREALVEQEVDIGVEYTAAMWHEALGKQHTFDDTNELFIRLAEEDASSGLDWIAPVGDIVGSWVVWANQDTADSESLRRVLKQESGNAERFLAAAKSEGIVVYADPAFVYRADAMKLQNLAANLLLGEDDTVWGEFHAAYANAVESADPLEPPVIGISYVSDELFSATAAQKLSVTFLGDLPPSTLAIVARRGVPREAVDLSGQFARTFDSDSALFRQLMEGLFRIR